MRSAKGSALVAAIVAAATLAGFVGSASAAPRTRSFVVYLKVTHEQFVNHADDRLRGATSSPFDPDANLPPPPNANKAKKGARSGDNAYFQFKLYSDAGLTKSIGTAIYSCTFNVSEQATCDANFELTNGTMFASGAADLSTGRFSLAVIGGTSGYLGSRGQLTSTPSGKKNTTRVDFLLVR